MNSRQSLKFGKKQQKHIRLLLDETQQCIAVSKLSTFYHPTIMVVGCRVFNKTGNYSVGASLVENYNIEFDYYFKDKQVVQETYMHDLLMLETHRFNFFIENKGFNLMVNKSTKRIIQIIDHGQSNAYVLFTHKHLKSSIRIRAYKDIGKHIIAIFLTVKASDNNSLSFEPEENDLKQKLDYHFLSIEKKLDHLFSLKTLYNQS